MEISSEHKKLLKWFANNEGKVLTGWPGPIGDDGKLFIVNRAKGIHKPAGFGHSTSLRVAFGDKYGDGPDIYSDDTWRLFYHFELRKNAADPLKFATNTGVLKCLEDGIPIGVIQQISRKPNRYKVFGLGMVTGTEGFHFVVEGPVSLSGNFTPKNSAGLQIDLSKILADSRAKTLTEVYRRQGQGKFRADLIDAYNGKCAISDCQILGLLDAAHILPHRGKESDFVQNGLLLRTDLHTLFDLGLLKINEETFICSIHESVQTDGTYESLDGKKISLPEDFNKWPSLECLKTFNELKNPSH